jgi:glycine cleavage system H protein
MSNIPDNLLYSREDEWIRVEGDEAVLGITDFAQDELSDIVYVELPDEGQTFQEGDSFGVVESVKAASDLYMPISGEVAAANATLPDAPEVVNSDPYGEGWMIRIKIADPSELESLLDPKAYSAFCDERS